jgi:Hydrazine synthase alpha subunit middle domain/WD40-like Beta Propeller Repeat
MRRRVDRTNGRGGGSGAERSRASARSPLGAGTRARSLLVVCALAALAALASGCNESAPDDLIQTEGTTDAIVFVKSSGGETLNRSWSDGNLFKLSPVSPEGVVSPITAFTGAAVSDPCVSFDGKKILFSMRPPGESWRNIYEIGVDGAGLRQITDGGGHDFDPLYLPDGRILFTSSRDGEMDEYNHAPSEHLYRCNGDGSELERVSFNQSDDFDPALLPDGKIVYTRWEHFGTQNRFPLFFTNPDGSGTFHKFGPHERNFFHAQPTPDGRIIAIESTEIEGDTGPIAVLKLEEGPADPANYGDGSSKNWDVVTPEVGPDGAPWPYGAFKYPFPLGENRYVVSYTLPTADEDEGDYALYTFTLAQSGAGTPESPATFAISDLSFLYNDPEMNEYDAQLIAPREPPPIVPSVVNKQLSYGVFMAQDVFNRGLNDGQERPEKGVDAIDRLAVIVGRPTRVGESGDFSANEFEKRALLGFAPVYEDGSFRIRVPADTPISFATLDDLDRGFVVKRTWLYVRPGEEFNKCVGCHEDRAAGGPVVTNESPIAATQEPTDLVLTPEEYTIINYEANIGPIVKEKCEGCHQPEYVVRYAKAAAPDTTIGVVIDTLPPPGDLDLTDVPDTTEMGGMGIFPRAYVNLSGESEMMERQVVVPAFPRRSILIDAILAVGARSDSVAHPSGDLALTPAEKDLFKLWVLLGAQYR